MYRLKVAHNSLGMTTDLVLEVKKAETTLIIRREAVPLKIKFQGCPWAWILPPFMITAASAESVAVTAASTLVCKDTEQPLLPHVPGLAQECLIDRTRVSWLCLSCRKGMGEHNTNILFYFLHKVKKKKGSNSFKGFQCCTIGNMPLKETFQILVCSRIHIIIWGVVFLKKFWWSLIVLLYLIASHPTLIYVLVYKINCKVNILAMDNINSHVRSRYL